MLPVRGCVSIELHLHRSCGEHRRGADLKRGALRQGLQHRLQPVHLLRLLRGSLPHRRDHAWSWLRAGDAERYESSDAQRRHAGEDQHSGRARCTALRGDEVGSPGNSSLLIARLRTPKWDELRAYLAADKRLSTSYAVVHPLKSILLRHTNRAVAQVVTSVGSR